MEKLHEQKKANIIVKESDYDLSQPHIIRFKDYLETLQTINKELENGSDLSEGILNGIQAVNEKKRQKLEAERMEKNRKVSSKVKKK